MFIDRFTLTVVVTGLVVAFGIVFLLLRQMAGVVGIGPHNESASEGPVAGTEAGGFSFHARGVGLLRFPDDARNVRFLLFADPGCGSCEALLSDLASDVNGVAERVLVVTTASEQIVGAYPGFREPRVRIARVGPRVKQRYGVRSSPFAVELTDTGMVVRAYRLNAITDLATTSPTQ